MSTTKDMKRFNALVEVAQQERLKLLQEEEEAAKKKQVRNIESSHATRRDRNSITSSDREEEEEEAKTRVRNNKSSHATKRDRNSITSSDLEEEKYSPKSKKLTKKRNGIKNINNGPEPPTPLPERFRQAMEEIAQGRNIMEIKLVLQKGLFPTDLSETQNRLSMPFRQIISHDFLSEEERVFLTTRNNNGMNYKEVTLIEPSLEHVLAKLSRWDMKKDNGNTSSCYVINGSWKHIVERNKLEPGMVLQIWAFRIAEELYLALVNLGSP